MQRIHTETRRDQIIAYIAEYAVTHHNAPSTIEISKKFEISITSVQHHIIKLIAEGRLERCDGHLKIPGAKYRLLLPGELPMERPASVPLQAKARKAYRKDHELIKMMYRQQGGNCWWCQKSLDGIYELDHRIPLAKGGLDTPENICLTHPECNRDKSDQMPGEYMEGRLL